MKFKLAARIGLGVAVLSVVLLAFQESLFGTGVLAITIQVAAALLMIWARETFGRRSFHADADPTEGGLMIVGPYRYLRHPIYASILYFVWAGVCSHLSFFSIFEGTALSVGLILRMRSEERLLVERYPEYAAYASRTKRIIPFIL